MFGLGPAAGPWIVIGAGGLASLAAGGLLTEIGPWYRALKKPSWQPPDFLFAPVWTTIFALGSWAGVLAWTHTPGTADRVMIATLLVLNGILNAGWSLFFFRWKRPDWALIEVVPLWLSVALLIAEFAGTTVKGAWLLTPYLAWVSFAAFLNFTIVKLNPRQAGFNPPTDPNATGAP